MYVLPSTQVGFAGKFERDCAKFCSVFWRKNVCYQKCDERKCCKRNVVLNLLSASR